MLKTITQHELFENVKTSTLFDLYMVEELHQQSTGAKAKIIAKEGGFFQLLMDTVWVLQ